MSDPIDRLAELMLSIARQQGYVTEEELIDAYDEAAMTIRREGRPAPNQRARAFSPLQMNMARELHEEREREIASMKAAIETRAEADRLRKQLNGSWAGLATEGEALRKELEVARLRGQPTQPLQERLAENERRSELAVEIADDPALAVAAMRRWTWDGRRGVQRQMLDIDREELHRAAEHIRLPDDRTIEGYQARLAELAQQRADRRAAAIPPGAVATPDSGEAAEQRVERGGAASPQPTAALSGDTP